MSEWARTSTSQLWRKQAPAVLITVIALIFVVWSYNYGEGSRQFPLIVGYATIALGILDMIARTESHIAAAAPAGRLQPASQYGGHPRLQRPRQRATVRGLRASDPAFDVSHAEVRPEDLLACDLDGRKIDGPEGVKPPSEIYIHSEILKRRPDVNAVAHFPNETATLFTLLENVPLMAVKDHAIRWASGIPVHPDPSHVNSPALGRALADTLGAHHAALIRAHSQVIVAEVVPAVLVDSIHFVENADALYRASQLGRVIPLTSEEVERFTRAQDRADTSRSCGATT